MPARALRYHQLVGNEIVLAGARNAAWIESEWRDDWHSNLLAHTFGISDPARDPAGYFAHLVWKLAEIHYNRPRPVPCSVKPPGSTLDASQVL